MKKIKKLTSVILAVVLIFAMSSVAFAAPNSGTPIGSAYKQQVFVMEASKLNVYRGGVDFPEEKLWDYDEHYKTFTDSEGNLWRYFDNLNWIVSKENNKWMYIELEDGTLYVISNPDVIHERNVTVPASLEGKTVSAIRSAGGMGLDDTPLSITIPDTITIIDFETFRNQNDLQRVVIPASVKSIDRRAFDLTDNIELYYCGTEEQWNEIVVWNHPTWQDDSFWAVTNYDWSCKRDVYDEKLDSFVKAVHFNVDPSTLEDIVPEPEEELESPFDGFLEGIRTFFATVTSFFKVIVSWFTFGK